MFVTRTPFQQGRWKEGGECTLMSKMIGGGTIINFSEIFPSPGPYFGPPCLFISRKSFYPSDNFSVVNHEIIRNHEENELVEA